MVKPETPEAESPEVAVARLAKLPPLEYDLFRKKEAERLGVRTVTLDAEVAAERGESADDDAGGGGLQLPEPEPWPEPVDGAQLLGDMVAVLHRYLALPEGAAEAMSLWVLHSHCLDAAQISPRLAFTSPTKRCGKSTALSLLTYLVPRPLPVANITPAAVFRTVEAAHPTLLVDEADSFLRDNDELRGILNSGHNRALSFVVRLVGENYEPKLFLTWCPTAIALIGRLPDTLEDRAIEVKMRRRRADEKLERLRLDKTGEFSTLASKAARWAEDHLDGLRRADPDMPATLHDRAADNWRPLLAIAGSVGGGWPATARAVAVRLSGNGDSEDSSVRVQLLADIKMLFAERGVTRLPSVIIVEHLASLEARPWPEWRHGKPITARQLARLLSAFGISPGTVRDGNNTPKGYKLSQFADTFSRYIPSLSATPPQAAENKGYSEFPSATPRENVADKKPEKPKETAGCGVVADQTGVPGAEWENEL